MPSQRSSSYALFLFALMCVAYLLIPFHRVSPAIMAGDIMRDLSLSAPSMGLLASTFFVVYGVMQMPGGLLTDGVGPRRLLPFTTVLAGLGAILFGFADSLALALAGRALMGFGVSVIFLCGMKLIGTWFPASQFVRMSGLFLGMGGVGMFLASEPLAVCCATWGWRASFFGCGAVSLALAAFLAVAVRDTPESRTVSSSIDWGLMINNTRLVMRHHDFWCACLWMTCHFSLNMSFCGLWGGTFLSDVHQLSQAKAGSILNMSGAGVLAGGFLVGWMCSNVFKSERKTMMAASAVVICLFGLLALAGEHLPVWSLYIWFFLLAVFGVPIHAAAFTCMRRIFGVKATGSACGLLNCLPSVGVLFFQPLTGVVLEQFPRTATGAFSPHAYAWACFLYLIASSVAFWAAWKMRESPAS